MGVTSRRNNKMYKPLDEYERNLKDALDETESFSRPKDYKKILAEAVLAANNTSSKTKTVNIRVAERDLIKLKAKAEAIGMPYHTVVNTLVHQYVKGDIKANI
jgi:predicted DNA binding CopG/RHH family protein